MKIAKCKVIFGSCLHLFHEKPITSLSQLKIIIPSSCTDARCMGNAESLFPWLPYIMWFVITIIKYFSLIAATKTAKDRYTEAQWQKLHEYWGHPLFQKSRPLGYFVCLAAIIIAIPPLISTNWIKLEVQKPVNYTYSKLVLITAAAIPTSLSHL